ncbi:MAG: response regulator [Candidatus Obscuribacterales bacterium]|nr:response regulator [Candidatus Obscuribacterales bacterium]
MDLNMPVMGGVEATQAIRAHELAQGWSPAIIIAITAGDSTKEQCLAAGMNDYARKPALFDEAKTLLRNWAPDLMKET